MSRQRVEYASGVGGFDRLTTLAPEQWDAAAGFERMVAMFARRAAARLRVPAADELTRADLAAYFHSHLLAAVASHDPTRGQVLESWVYGRLLFGLTHATSFRRRTDESYLPVARHTSRFGVTEDGECLSLAVPARAESPPVSPNKVPALAVIPFGRSREIVWRIAALKEPMRRVARDLGMSMARVQSAYVKSVAAVKLQARGKPAKGHRRVLKALAELGGGPVGSQEIVARLAAAGRPANWSNVTKQLGWLATRGRVVAEWRDGRTRLYRLPANAGECAA